MINLKVETGSPFSDKNVIEEALSRILEIYTVQEQEGYLMVGLKEKDAPVARYELRMKSFRIV